MSEFSGELAALIGSRICHDLVSPVGAIANGLELVALSDRDPRGGPEFDLIEQSCRNATARLRFYRVAFGSAPLGQSLSRPEICGILDDLTAGGRMQVEWLSPAPVARDEVQLAFLLILCVESALPRGGALRVTRDGPHWQAHTDAPGLRIDPGLWTHLDPGCAAPETERAQISPGRVQFRLLDQLAKTCGRAPRVTVAEAALTVCV